MDRSAIRTLIQAAGYGTSTDAVAAQNQAITATLLELSGERSWSWLRESYATTLLVGNPACPLPTDIDFPVEIRLSFAGIGYNPIEKSEGTEVQRLLQLDGTVGQPTKWNWFERAVWVNPRPDIAYDVDLDYIKVPDLTTFDTDAEVPPFSLRFHAVLSWGAIRYLAIRARDGATAAIASAEYANAKLKMERADHDIDDQRHVDHWIGWATLE